LDIHHCARVGVRRTSISRPLFEPLPLTLFLGELRSNIFIVDYFRVATCSSRGCCATTQNALTAKVEEMTAQMAALQEEIEQLKSAQENQEGDAAAE